MPAKPTNAAEYLDTLPEDRREMIEAILQTIRKNLDPKFEEGMQYGMPAFFLPHEHYADGYHCDPKQPVPFAGISSRKANVSLYLFGVYCDQAESERFVEAWKATGKRLDMGKSCIRMKKLEQVPLDVIGKTIKRLTAQRFLAAYTASIPASKKKK